MANNVTWSTLYLGNFADMDTNEASASVEDASALLTTFGAGPGNALSNNITDVQSWGGSNDSVETDNAGTPDYVAYDIGDGPETGQIDSVVVLAGTVTFHDGTTFSNDFGVFQDTNGNIFMMVLDSSPELASQGIDTVTFTSVVTSDFSGVNQFNKDDLDFVCLTAGCLVETPTGPVRTDRLRRGDVVNTLDRGPQPIVWIGKRRLRFDTRPGPGQPIRIAQNTLGPGLPHRDTLLSPHHRLLAQTSPGYALHDPLGALAPAKALTRHTGIRALRGRREITYFSLLLPRHEIIIANGIAVESLYPGPEVFAALSAPERSEWMRLAARDGRVTGTPPARLMLTVAEARAALDAKLLKLPAQAPRPLTWSLSRHRPRARPDHLAQQADVSGW